MPKRYVMTNSDQPLPENTVYVGKYTKWDNVFRPGHPNILVYMNGFVVSTMKVYPVDEADCLKLYRRRLECLLHLGMFTQAEVDEIRGKDLASFHPKGKPCYVDVLLEVINGKS